MRLRSDIFVSALIRRVFSAGGYAAVEHRGADQAGAIFLRQHFRDGLESLYGPAPQSLFSTEDSGDRLFELRLERQPPDLVAAALAREFSFDSDCWVVSLEHDDLTDFVPLAKG